MRVDTCHLQTRKALRLLLTPSQSKLFLTVHLPIARPRKKGMVSGLLISLGTSPSETTHPAL